MASGSEFVCVLAAGLLACVGVACGNWCIQPATIRVSQNDTCHSPRLVNTSQSNITWFAMRGERESSQLMLEFPPNGKFSLEFSDLRSATGSKIPSSALSYRQVMYVFCSNSTLEQQPYAEWVADPLLPGDGGGGAFSLVGSLTQVVWMSVEVPRDAVPAVYSGSVTWTLQTSLEQSVETVPISLHVWNITVPSLAAASFTMTFSHGGFAGVDNGSLAMQQQYYDMLTAYRMPPDALYSIKALDDDMADYLASTGTQYFNLVNFQQLVVQILNGGDETSIKEATWKHQQFGLLGRQVGIPPLTGPCHVTANVSDAVLNKALDILSPAVLRAEKSGYLDRTYVYGFDEAPEDCLPGMRRLFAAVKARFPKLRLSAVLNWPTMPIDVPLDIWVMEYYRWETPSIRASAQAWAAHDPQRRVFFYHCVDPAAPTKLNSFTDRPLLETRLLFWDAAAKSPSIAGWLYYAVNAWHRTAGSTQYVTRVNSTARTNFNQGQAFSNNRIANGDGIFIYPSESGPVASVRMEAFRDAAEDVELLRLLPLEAAQSLVRQIVRASDDFTLDPILLERLRAQAAAQVLKSH